VRIGTPPRHNYGGEIITDMRFRKRPVVIEAIQWTGGNIDEILAFMSPEKPVKNADDLLSIPTLEGDHVANKDDWIIKGVKGEFYPCKSDIFEMTYEPVK